MMIQRNTLHLDAFGLPWRSVVNLFLMPCLSLVQCLHAFQLRKNETLGEMALSHAFCPVCSGLGRR